VRRRGQITRVFVGLLVLALALSCATKRRPEQHRGPRLKGLASYYASRFHGRQTASGEIYDENALTAAHRTLRFGTRVRVTNLKNGKSVVVRINDRGPYGDRRRVIDLSLAAARELEMVEDGLVRVRLKVLPRSKGQKPLA